MGGEDEAGVGQGQDLLAQAVVELRPSAARPSGEEVGLADVADEEGVARGRRDRLSPRAVSVTT